MTTKELLIPRFEVIEEYPRCEFEKGVILCRIKYATNDVFHSDEHAPVGGLDLTELKKYPHLFKKLNWWDERTVDDMPTFIKSQTKVVEPNWILEEWKGVSYLRAYDAEAAKYHLSASFKLELFKPATKSEFNKFISGKKTTAKNLI